VVTFIEPMAAQLVKALPEVPQWLYQLKIDGYRGLLVRSRQHVQLVSRNNKDLTSQFLPVS